MNVLHLAHSCNRGGAEALLLNLCKESLQDSDMHFEVITDLGGSLELDFANTLGRKFKKWPRKGLLDWEYIKRLREYVMHNSIDVIHTHTAGDALYAWLAIKSKRIPIVDTHHGFRLQSSLKSRIVARFMLNRVQCSVFVSNALFKSVYPHSDPSEGNAVVYNGVEDSSADSNHDNESSLRDELGIPQSVPLIGMVGNFVNQVRDPLTICKGVHLALSRGIEFRIVFVGRKNPLAPRFYDECFEYCRMHDLLDSIYFLGSRSDVPRILRELNGFVYSTREDTFGIAVVEAALAGLPILVNDHPTMIEVLGPFEPEYFRSENADDFARHLKHWIPRLNELSQRSQELATLHSQIYSIQNCFENYRKVYRKVCYG